MAAEEWIDLDFERMTGDYMNESDPEWPYTKCPKCDGKLVKRYRKADRHEFIGCANFPKCRFSCSVSDTEDYQSETQRKNILRQIDECSTHINKLSSDINSERARLKNLHQDLVRLGGQ